MSPKWRVHDAAGRYKAWCKDPDAAAVLTAFYGPGATVRHGRRVMYTHSAEPGESYDAAVSAFEVITAVTRLPSWAQSEGKYSRRLRGI